MGKHKKKHSKKAGVSDDILDAAAISIKKYRKVTNEIAKLSTGQKVVGSAILLAAGYFYLDKLGATGPDSPLAGLNFSLPGLGTGASRAKPAPADDEEDEDDEPSPPPVAHRKGHKGGKAGKGRSFGRQPAASPDEDQ